MCNRFKQPHLLSRVRRARLRVERERTERAVFTDERRDEYAFDLLRYFFRYALPKTAP